MNLKYRSFLGLLKSIGRILNFTNNLNEHSYYIDWTPRYSDIEQFLLKFLPFDVNLPKIRIGSEYDGGYILPEDLVGIDQLFSPGVGDNSTFEFDLITNFGIHCNLIDGNVSTPGLSSIQYNEVKSKLTFDSLFLAPYSDYENRKISLEDWVRSKTFDKPTSELMLQMDIEGSEWEVLLSTPMQILKSFRIMVIEFHQLELCKNRRSYETLLMPVMEKLNSLFTPVHVHVNSDTKINSLNKKMIFPDILEVTYLRKDRAHFSKLFQFSHYLDSSNSPLQVDLKLETFWPFKNAI